MVNFSHFFFILIFQPFNSELWKEEKNRKKTCGCVSVEFSFPVIPNAFPPEFQWKFRDFLGISAIQAAFWQFRNSRPNSTVEKLFLFFFVLLCWWRNCVFFFFLLFCDAPIQRRGFYLIWHILLDGFWMEFFWFLVFGGNSGNFFTWIFGKSGKSLGIFLAIRSVVFPRDFQWFLRFFENPSKLMGFPAFFE